MLDALPRSGVSKILRVSFSTTETGRTGDVHVLDPSVLSEACIDEYHRFLKTFAPDADPETYQLAPSEVPGFVRWFDAE